MFAKDRKPLLSKSKTNLVESLNLEILERYTTTWIVSLQCKSSFIQDSGKVLACLLIGWLVVFDDNFSVNFESDLLALNDDLLSVPYAR